MVGASDQCLEGHRFNSCQEIRFFLCPALLICWLRYFSKTLTWYFKISIGVYGHKVNYHCDILLVFIGIWIRDIRFKSNIQLTQVNKILKNLESKKLIKAVKSVAVSTNIEGFNQFPWESISITQIFPSCDVVIIDWIKFFITPVCKESCVQ